MKKIIVSAITVFAMVAGVAIAQNKEIVQPTHPHKVYVDKENAKIYIWKTGIYLYFGAEDGSETKKYQLINKNSAGQDVVSPFYLDNEGINTIIEPNPKNRRIAKDKDSEFLIYGDWSAPRTTISTNVKEHIVLDKREIRGSVFDVILTAKEKKNGSGVSEVYLSKNDGDFNLYEYALPIEDEGLYTIRYYAVDNVGNVEKAKSKLYGLDLTPPVTYYTVMSGNIGDILSPRALISLTAHDNMAGVKGTNYFIDENKVATYKKPISTKSLAEGNHVLYFHSHDRVNNLEADLQYNFYLDRTAPFTTLSIEGDQYSDGDNTYVSERSRIALNANDNKVDVKNIYFSLNGRNEEVYSRPLALVTSKIKHRIAYRADDTLLNMAKYEKENFILDVELPIALQSFEGGHFNSNGIDYINSTSTVNIQVSDDLSGIQKTLYALNSGQEMEGNRFSLNSHGPYDMTYYTVDNVNNYSETKSAKLFVDTKEPSVAYEFGVKNIQGETTKLQGNQSSGNEPQTFPEKSVLFLYGSDDDSGVHLIKYQINGGLEQVYTTPVDFENPGDYTIDVTVIDNVGNTKMESISTTIAGSN